MILVSKRIWIFLLLLLAVNPVCLSQQVIDVSGNEYRNLGREAGFWCDLSRTASFADVAALPDSCFRPARYPIFNGATTGNVWWARLQYRADSNLPPFLIISYPNIDSIELYYKNRTDGITRIQAGSFFPDSSRVFASTEYIFDLSDADEAGPEIFIRATTINTLVVPLKLVDGLTLAKGLSEKYMFHFLLVGIAFALSLFNLFMWSITRSAMYGYYLIRILCLFYVFVIAYLNGFGHFLGPLLKQGITVYAYVFAGIGFVFTIIFNNAFLKVKRHLPGVMPVMQVLLMLWIIDIFLSLAGFRFAANKIMQILIVLTSFMILYTSIRIINIVGYRKKHPLIRFYIIGWIPISAATLYIVPAMVDMLPMQDYSMAFLEIAAILEGIFITLALVGHRFHTLQEEKKRAEEHNIKLVRERNKYLEEKIRERTLTLEQTVKKLEDSNAEKNKLFSIIAHDLRSPLSSLSAVLQLGEGYPLTGDFLESVLKEIRKDTEQVQKTMDNLLHWAMIQMDVHQYHPEHISLKDFLAEHWHIYESLAKRKSITADIIAPDCYVGIMADRNQLSLIVRNFIDNAVKFSPAGGSVEIGIRLGDESYILYVANTGMGISEEMIARILSNEQIIGTSYGTANEKGTGLGLQLCKEYIRNLGSTLMVTSEPDERTEFAFVFSAVYIVSEVEV